MSLRDGIVSGFARLTTAILNLRTVLVTRTTPYISNTPPDPAVHGTWFNLAGEHFVWDGLFWFQVIGPVGGGGSGTVTSVAISVPIGLSGSGPVTTDGTLTISYAAGYSIPTTANQGNWSTAFGWGNHGSAGYQAGLVSGTNIKTINGQSVLGSGNLVVSGGGGSASPILSWAL